MPLLVGVKEKGEHSNWSSYGRVSQCKGVSWPLKYSPTQRRRPKWVSQFDWAGHRVLLHVSYMAILVGFIHLWAIRLINEVLCQLFLSSKVLKWLLLEWFWAWESPFCLWKGRLDGHQYLTSPFGFLSPGQSSRRESQRVCLYHFVALYGDVFW